MSVSISSELLNSAVAEMTRLGDSILHPEYLLLAVTDAAPLRRRGVTRDELRSQLMQLYGPVPTVLPGLGGANDTSSRILAHAKQRAAGRSVERATRDDVLFALLDETEGPQLAPAVLNAMGLDVQSIRAELAAAG